MTGCWATLEREATLALPKVSQVVADSNEDRLVPELLDLPEESFDLEPLAAILCPVFTSDTGISQSTDGCDNHCTFCMHASRGAAAAAAASQR